MQEIKVMKSQHATKEINQRWHIPAAATVRSRMPSVVRSALLSKTWHPFVIIDHNLPRGRQGSLTTDVKTFFCMLLLVPFPFYLFTMFIQGSFVSVLGGKKKCKQWDSIKVGFMSKDLLFGIFLWDCIAHWDIKDQIQIKKRKKEIHACADTHQQTCWQVGRCGCYIDRQEQLLHLCVLRCTEQQQPWHLQ